ncbi:hypothetical protein [Spirulina sp. CCNP1310]|uniref:hypothetical protein n=1 Tax=Spirulina sp. CCNP1310 TaxID=3110249 RepID=UPI002B20CB9D|nr:hypothetical protein [Spirulina sp. CCNP1310]
MAKDKVGKPGDKMNAIARVYLKRGNDVFILRLKEASSKALWKDMGVSDKAIKPGKDGAAGSASAKGLARMGIIQPCTIQYEDGKDYVGTAKLWVASNKKISDLLGKKYHGGNIIKVTPGW